MQNSFDKYIEEAKSRLDKNFLSPEFIRLANMYYLSEQYEECISVCRSGLNIYPNYLTAKLILIRALLKAEYLSEAEQLYNELKSKIPVKEVLSGLSNNIQNLRSISGQEKIQYTKEAKNKFDFKYFEKKFDLQETLFTEYKVTDLLNDDEINLPETEFRNFESKYLSFHFNLSDKSVKSASVNQKKSETETSYKFVTETLGDLYAGQKNHKEAYEIYSFLLRAGSPNSARIEEKLNALERNMIKYDSN